MSEIKIDRLRRLKRAVNMYNDERIKKIDRYHYEVKGEGGNWYPLEIDDNCEWYCGCRDNIYRCRICKHMYILFYFLMKKGLEGGEL